ncbi:MAG: hypothetical protein ABJB74_18245 [Gemmatimonas sp.]
MILSKSWLLLTVPLAIVALVLLSLMALSLLRTVRRSVVVSVPVRAEQSISFKEGGSYMLNIEGAALSRVATGLSFAITASDGAANVPLRRVIVHTKVSSFSRTRLELYSFDVPAPGAYVLRVHGADSSLAHIDAAIVLTRPFTAALVLHVLGLIALGAMLIGSLVVTGLVLAKRPVTSATINAASQSVC